jgi:hypothetical protein
MMRRIAPESRFIASTTRASSRALGVASMLRKSRSPIATAVRSISASGLSSMARKPITAAIAARYTANSHAIVSRAVLQSCW